MDAQIREYSAMKLKAEIELGKKTAEIPAFPGRRDLGGGGDKVGKRQTAEMPRASNNVYTSGGIHTPDGGTPAVGN